MLKKSRTGVVKLKCPLKFLNPLFAAPMYLPARNIISLTLSLRDDKQLLCVSSSDNVKYKIEMKEISLKLKHVTFHDKIKERWEAAIDAHGLRRNVQCDKMSHFVMKKGVQSFRFPSIFSWSTIPSLLLVFFQKESTIIGDASSNRYCFKDPGLRSVSLFKNGISHPNNLETTNMKMEKNSDDHMYWYSKLMRFFGETAYDIAPDQYIDNLFILSWNMTVAPLVEDETLIATDARKLNLSPIDAGSLDFQLETHEALTTNYMIYFLGFYSQELIFTKNGLPWEA